MIFYPGQTGLHITNRALRVTRPRGDSVLYNSLVAFWELDEASGNRADSIGSNTLTDTNTVTSNTGLVYPLAAEFTAANAERLTIGDNAALSMGDIDFWMAAWFYEPTDNGGSHTLINKDASGSQREYRFGVNRIGANDYRPSIHIFNNGGANQALQWTTGVAMATWHLAIAWHDSVNNLIGLSIDNATAQTVSYSGGSANSNSLLDIGRLTETGGNFMNGRIGPAMIGKNYIPTIEDRDFLYNSGAGRTFDAMRGY